MGRIQAIEGLQEALKVTNARGVILDIFGVIHDGEKSFPYTIEALQSLKTSGIKISFLL